MNNLISQDYLMHYGVKGMKWGVRHDSESFLGKRAKARRESLKAHGYKKYSKTNDPISATRNASKELHDYRKNTASLIRSQTTGKDKIKTFMQRYGNEPVTILGFTGTAKTTRKKYLMGIYPGNGLF